ncbi:MAG: hypothetical protein CFE21_17655 [Bacteroidetes bacterium B1(2017)]|nr:MAG: hypothetical protein CFE21_17655 [Bacteroidetes bacterium B1(2017)]
MLFVHADPKILVVIQTQIGLTEQKHFENFSIVEFKPKLNDHWGLYTIVQPLLIIQFSQSLTIEAISIYGLVIVIKTINLVWIIILIFTVPPNMVKTILEHFCVQSFF